MTEAVVQGILKQEIIRLLRLIPLSDHCDLIAHEIELLARVHKHIHIKRPALREFHLIGSEDLVDHCLFTVHDLVV